MLTDLPRNNKNTVVRFGDVRIFTRWCCMRRVVYAGPSKARFCPTIHNNSHRFSFCLLCHVVPIHTGLPFEPLRPYCLPLHENFFRSGWHFTTSAWFRTICLLQRTGLNPLTRSSSTSAVYAQRCRINQSRACGVTTTGFCCVPNLNYYLHCCGLAPSPICAFCNQLEPNGALFPLLPTVFLLLEGPSRQLTRPLSNFIVRGESTGFLPRETQQSAYRFLSLIVFCAIYHAVLQGSFLSKLRAF